MEKIALLAAYFCQITPANHLLEMGFGNETITKRLIQEKLFKIPATKSLGQETEAAIQQIQRHTSLDFVLIHPQLSADYLQEALTLLVPRMQGQGILLLVGIHKNKGIHAHWKKLQADPRIPLTLDFFDFGVAFLSYSGPKTNVSLSY
ncbi:MAG: hypothetical protein NBV57_01480 [Algoriphagus sp.]|nr:hypothetical protein [Algoriphagus sp.]